MLCCQVALQVDTSEKSARIVKARLERTTLGQVLASSGLCSTLAIRISGMTGTQS